MRISIFLSLDFFEVEKSEYSIGVRVSPSIPRSEKSIPPRSSFDRIVPEKIGTPRELVEREPVRIHPDHSMESAHWVSGQASRRSSLLRKLSFMDPV